MRLTHGARSLPVKRADTKRIERAVASQNGVQLRNMTGQQRRYLRLYAEALRLVERLEPINPDGNANGNMNAFMAAVNSAGRALERFEVAMGAHKQQRDRQGILDELSKYRGGAAS